MIKRTSLEGIDQATSLPEDASVRSTRLTTYFWLLVVIWTIIMIGLLALDFLQIKQVQREMAITEARANFNKDQAFRFWSSKHGGVYVPINSRTPENPFLSHVSERDITTKSGKALTLMNPAYMLRQMLEEYEDLFGIRGHITSLKHYRPETAPDEWEKAALAAFERGDKEVLEFAEIKGTPYLRLMQPMIAKKSCLKCHAKQGYKVGDVRGGVSISVPMSLHLTNERKMFTTHVFGLGLMWLLGIAGIGMATRGLRNRIRERDRAEAELQKAHDCLEIRVDERTAELKNELEERKQTELRLRESEEKYSKLFHSNPQWLHISTLEDGRYVEVNEATREITGYERDELIGRTSKELGLWADYEERSRLVKIAREQGGFRDQEVTFIRKNGESASLLWSAATIEIMGTAYFINSVADISDRKRAEEEKERLQSQLQQAQKMEAVGTLAGGIAHDFNNILAVILGNAELASDDIPDWNPASKSLKAIHQASIRAKDMVKHLLAFSRKSGEVNRPINIAPIVQESMEMLRSAVPTSIAFDQHISGETCNILGDAAQINQIVMNLVTNAAHAMAEEGGHLEVTLEKVDLPEEKSCFNEVLPPGAYVRLKVRDTGEGIEPEIMERIFDPYFTTKEVGKGTGMGLSVIHSIVKSYDGGIRVESELGKGTLFEIYFPALEKMVEEEKKPEGEIRRGSERILFVDDEESMVDLNRQRLERLGYQVKSTTKPLEALEWFRADPDQFDVIITDMTMPRMTGDKLAAEILEIRPHMPVIICTGYSERMSAKKADALGVSKYIEKPIGARNLASSLREVLDGARS